VREIGISPRVVSGLTPDAIATTVANGTTRVPPGYLGAPRADNKVADAVIKPDGAIIVALEAFAPLSSRPSLL
jgi:hypothetical protein